MPTVGKLVTLKLEGNFEQHGFRVSLEISQDGDRPFSEASGSLPPDLELTAHLTQWQQAYRQLGTLSRIKPKEIIYSGSIQQREACRTRAKVLSNCLNHWLASDSFRAIDTRLREALSLDEPIRVLIRSENQTLRHLPWHLWEFIDRYTHAEVAFCASAHRITAKSTPNHQVRILAILGNSSGIDVAADRQLLENLPDADVQFLVEPRRPQINRQLWDQPWDILFFAGHSETEAEQGHLYINAYERLTLDELRYGLRQAIEQGLRLAIFNSCDGLGLVRQLEQINLPQIIAMREPIPDRIAQEFLKHFLIAFAQGDSLYPAVRRSREQLQGWEGEFPCASWLPMICQNAWETPPDWQDLCGGQSDSSNSSDLQGSSTPGQQRKRQIWHKLQVLLLVASLITSAIVGMRSMGWLQSFELRAFDQLVRLRPAEPADPRLLIIGVSEADIQYQDQLGMERRGSLADRALLQVVQRLEPYQPRAIGLDIYHDFQFAPNLAQALRTSDRFFAICKSTQQGDSPSIAPPDLPPTQTGFSDWVIDPDRVVRRHLLGMTSSSTCPTDQSLSLRIAMRYLGISKIQRTASGDIAIGNLKLPKLEFNSGGYQLAPDQARGYQILLSYRSSPPTQIALRDLLDGSLTPQLADLVRNRIILIGVAQDNVDRHPSPYQVRQDTPGVVIHAQMISQLISAVQNQRVLLWWLPEWAECLWIGSWAIVGGALVLGWQLVDGRSWQLGLAIVISLASLYGCCLLLLLWGGWLPLIPAALALLSAATAVATGTTEISTKRQPP